MHIMNRVLVAAAIFSSALATSGNAAEGTTSRVSATPLQSRNVAKARTELKGFSETADLDIWLIRGGSLVTNSPHVYVEITNRGVNSAYPRDYVLVFSKGDQLWMIFDQQTGVLAPNASSSKKFFIPKKFFETGATAEAGLLGSDDNPSNDYHMIRIPPLSSGI